MKVKSSGKNIDLKDVSPSWKVLQMKLKEEKANKRKDVSDGEPSKSSDFSGNKKANKRNKRKLKLQAALDAAAEEGRVKKANVVSEIPIFADKKERGEPTNLLALDCEYVGVGFGGTQDALARVSIVNENGAVVYDKYVKVDDKITDYRTHVSGIRPKDLVNGENFQAVQMEVARIIKDRIVVGHALHNDFRVLNIVHKRALTRDTAKCHTLKAMANFSGANPSLKKLADVVLGVPIQQGEHDSITDARVALRLYLAVKKKWEAEIKRFHSKK